jgi:hypothetical protein
VYVEGKEEEAEAEAAPLEERKLALDHVVVAVDDVWELGVEVDNTLVASESVGVAESDPKSDVKDVDKEESATGVAADELEKSDVVVLLVEAVNEEEVEVE